MRSNWVLTLHPRYFFERSPEHGLIAPDNLVILSHHLKCAAFELPFDKGETFGRFAQTRDLLDTLADDAIVHKQGKIFWDEPILSCQHS
jgi:DEAD/DEAH box helicase domain-containing protein